MEYLQHGQVVREPIDLLCLAAVPKPDVKLQQKYDAMGLPDPVAFAMLVALGAIPDPMALLNEMMATPNEEEEKAAFWKSGQVPLATAEASDSAELERLAKQVKEAAEQARAATVAGGTGGAAGDVTLATRNVAQAFNQAEEEEPQRPAPLGTTLSSLLTGRERSNQDAGLTLPTTLDKVALSRLPQGITEAQIRLECARHGALTTVVLEDGGNGSGVTAYVCYASSDRAQYAVRKMTGAKIGLFGTEPVQVKLISELPESVRPLAQQSAPAFSEAQPINPQQLPQYLRGASRSGGRKRASRSTRRKKRKSRSAKRWLDRSRSNSHTATGQYIRATGCSSTVRWWERRRDSDDSDHSANGRTKRAQKAEAELVAKRPRQVGIRGLWAQFVYSGFSYYFNIRTEQTVWETPEEFEEEKSKHQTNAII